MCVPERAQKLAQEGSVEEFLGWVQWAFDLNDQAAGQEYLADLAHLVSSSTAGESFHLADWGEGDAGRLLDLVEELRPRWGVRGCLYCEGFLRMGQVASRAGRQDEGGECRSCFDSGRVMQDGRWWECCKAEAAEWFGEGGRGWPCGGRCNCKGGCNGVVGRRGRGPSMRGLRRGRRVR